MTKYDPLKNYLCSFKQPEIKLSFSEIERMLGFKLPYSAYTYPAWWANGGHSQADSWTGAGYITKSLDIPHQTVVFCKQETQKRTVSYTFQQKRAKKNIPAVTEKFCASNHDFLSVCGYEFRFLQQLIPECKNGQIVEYYPQKEYINKDNLPLSAHGSGSFCRFSIHAPAASGVYLWVADNEIIYIGETVNLQQRFNVGYGNISPRNCYIGGQSTNCKMNKVAMEYFNRGKPVNLYFYQTENNKQVELDLLKQIHTKYNVKDNDTL